ncbi:roadblock/LC7 domain-containing protein [Leucobacter sp. HY1908]
MYPEEAVLADQHNPVTVAACQRALEELSQSCRSLQVAAFATDDGFEITRYPVSLTDHDQRLTSMASSLQALTEAVALDRAIGEAQYTLIEADYGRVLLRRVPKQSFVLLAVFGAEERSGQAILSSRNILQELGGQLAGSSPAPAHGF